MKGDLNHEMIRARFAEIEESLERLDNLRNLSREEFLSSQDTIDIACYRLLIAIEAALNVCYHVSAKRLQRVPEEYAQCFVLLEEAGIIQPELSSSLQRMAKFRNLLVHVYWKVDYGQVYDIIERNLEDLRSFERAVARLL